MENFLFAAVSTVWFASMLAYVFVVADGDNAFFSKDCSTSKKTAKFSKAMIVLFILCPPLIVIHTSVLVKKIADSAKDDCQYGRYDNNLQNKNFSKLYNECYRHFKEPPVDF